jgi:hypothetical protein
VVVQYAGNLLETYPARINEIHYMFIYESAPRMINVSGIIYIDTGMPIPAEIDPAHILGSLHTQVEGRPRNHAQGNFDCVGCQFAWVEGNIAVLINNEWYLFEKEILEFPEYYLTIPMDGVVYIQTRSGSQSGVMAQETFAPYEKGVSVLLELLTGKERLNGATITALDAENQELFTVTVTAKEYGNNVGVIEKDGWVITPVTSDAEREAFFLKAELERLEDEMGAQETITFTVYNDPDPQFRNEEPVTYQLTEQQASVLRKIFREHEHQVIEWPTQSIASLEFRYGEDFLLTSLDALGTLNGQIDGQLVLVKLTEEEEQELFQVISEYFYNA